MNIQPIAKEDLAALQKRNFRLIFIMGPPGSGKLTQCLKLMNEFKYIHIDTDKLIQDQIDKKTELGDQCQDFLSKNQIIPFELIISVLVRQIVNSTNRNILITGFPRKIEEALYFEKNICQINLILNITCSDEICYERINNRGKSSLQPNQADLDKSLIYQRISDYKISASQVIDYYKRYGLVRHINSEKNANLVFEEVKENLYPAIYSIIGKKYSGKTRISKELSERMGFKLIDFKEFMKSDVINKRKDDDAFVVSMFINKLREEQSARVLIEDFPIKREHYSLFVKNCKNVSKIFYLNVEDYIATERMNKIPYDDARYIGCSKLTAELYEFDQKKELMSYLKKKSNLVEVDVNNYFDLTIDCFMRKNEPNVLLFTGGKLGNIGFRGEIIEYFKINCGYEVVDVKRVLKDNIERHTTVGKLLLRKGIHKSNIDDAPADIVVEALKPVLFKETSTKFTLINFPDTIAELQEFEKSICKVERMILVNSDNTLPIQDNSVELYLKNDHRLSIYSKSELDTYLIDTMLNKTRNFDIVYGRPYDGKSCIINHLAAKYSYKVIDFVELIKTLKTEKGAKEDPPQDWESTELNYQELLEGWKALIANMPLSTKFTIENLLQNDLILESNQAKEILEVAGKVRKFYRLTCDEAVMIDRYKQKKGIEEELSEDAKAEMMESWIKPKEIIEYLNNNSYSIIDVNTNLSEYKTQLTFDSAYGRNLIVVKHDYDLRLDSTINLFAGCRQALVVNVPRIIYMNFYNNNSWAKKLEATYFPKRMKVTEYNSEEEKIYYRYNPVHFDEEIVRELIYVYIAENIGEIEENGNYIILTGYLNSDLLVQDEEPFNLPLYEINKLEQFGK